VKDGVVYLSGVVADDLEVNALQISVESLPGVRGVKADLAVMPRSIAAI
jgi:osmotically-inducible protein OsmY